ncbi:MAG: class A beta-lactamase [Pseudomonadota bacterium]
MSCFSKAALSAGIILFSAMASTHNAGAEPILGAVRGIERDLGARVGFYMHDTQTDAKLSYADNDRFPLNSTFKLLACGAFLSRVEAGTSRLADTVSLEDLEIVTYSPAIEDHVSAGKTEVSFDEACRMMLSVSDNSAANIVLGEIDGPAGLTAFLRSIGDDQTRLDRWETALNEAVPGDLRDTTTPRAIAHSMEQLILGKAISPASQTLLQEWLSHHSVAGDLFRAALPSSWSIADRTGAGGYGSRSIIAVLYPPDRNPIIATLFMTETEASFKDRNAAVARVGAAIVASVAAD